MMIRDSHEFCLAMEAVSALATVHYDHMGSVHADVERCFKAAKELYHALNADPQLREALELGLRHARESAKRAHFSEGREEYGRHVAIINAALRAVIEDEKC